MESKPTQNLRRRTFVPSAVEDKANGGGDSNKKHSDAKIMDKNLRSKTAALTEVRQKNYKYGLLRCASVFEKLIKWISIILLGFIKWCLVFAVQFAELLRDWIRHLLGYLKHPKHEDVIMFLYVLLITPMLFVASFIGLMLYIMIIITAFIYTKIKRMTTN